MKRIDLVTLLRNAAFRAFRRRRRCGSASLFAVVTVMVCGVPCRARELPPEYIALVDSADHCMKKGDWHESQRMLLTTLKRFPGQPGNWLLWSNLGAVRTCTGDYEGAVEACDIGLASAPNSTVLLTNKARALLGCGRTQEAAGVLDAALDRDSTLAWPLKIRGILALEAGDTLGAARLHDHHRRLYGDDSSVVEAWGDFRAMAGRETEALEHYKQALQCAETQGEDPERQLELTEKYLLAAVVCGRCEEIAAQAATACVRWPQSGKVALVRACVARARYQTDEMERWLRRARELHTDPTLIAKLL